MNKELCIQAIFYFYGHNRERNYKIVKRLKYFTQVLFLNIYLKAGSRIDRIKINNSRKGLYQHNGKIRSPGSSLLTTTQ